MTRLYAKFSKQNERSFLPDEIRYFRWIYGRDGKVFFLLSEKIKFIDAKIDAKNDQEAMLLFFIKHEVQFLPYFSNFCNLFFRKV